MIFRFANRLPSKMPPPSRAAKRTGQRRSEPGSTEAAGSRANVTDSIRETQLLPLCDLPQGVHAIIHEIHLAAGAAEQVMLFGFMKGVEVVAGQCGPGGCPRVYRLDGTEVAIRRATSRHIMVRIPSAQEQA